VPARSADLRAERGQRLGELVRALRALIAILRERVLHDGVELRRDLGPRLADRRDLRVEHDRRHRLVLARAFVERAPGERLVEADAEREHVAAPVERHALVLLGRDVRELPLEVAGLGLVLLRRGLRHAEVEQLRDAVEADHDVLGVHVAVHDRERVPRLIGAGVRVMQRARDVGEDLHDERDRQQIEPPGQQIAERDAAHPLHREEERAGRLAELVDRADVRMRQVHTQLRLVHEHLDHPRILRVVGEDALHHDVALDRPRARLAREEDLGHAARREPTDDVVAPDLGDRR
jgi:hypothetical protein